MKVLLHQWPLDDAAAGAETVAVVAGLSAELDAAGAVTTGFGGGITNGPFCPHPASRPKTSSSAAEMM